VNISLEQVLLILSKLVFEGMKFLLTTNLRSISFGSNIHGKANHTLSSSTIIQAAWNKTSCLASHREDSNITLIISNDENGRRTPKLFSTFTFEIRKQKRNGKTGHENVRELTNYREFQKRTNSSGFMSNMVDIRKLNTEYRPVDQVHD